MITEQPFIRWRACAVFFFAPSAGCLYNALFYKGVGGKYHQAIQQVATGIFSSALLLKIHLALYTVSFKVKLSPAETFYSVF